VDHVHAVAVLYSDIHARSVIRWPDAVRQCADWDRRDELWLRFEGIDLDHVFAADGHIGQCAAGSLGKAQMIGDEASVDHTYHLELGGVDAGDLADVLVRHPHFLEVGCKLKEWRKWTRHRDTLDYLVAAHIDDVHFGRKARYHECCPAILLKQHHAGTRCGLDAAYLLKGVRIDDRNVVLASNDDPHFLA